jgi:hypothetical protein
MANKRKLVQCAEQGCTVKGSKRCKWSYKYDEARFCDEHYDKDNMVRYGVDICCVVMCLVTAVIGNVWNMPTHCKGHRQDGDMDVKNKRCVGTECGGTKHPTFGIGDGPATHCKACKTPDMVDVKSKRCVGTECGGTKHPTFGIGDGPATHCKACKTPDMVDVQNKRCVGTECGGTKRPTFGIGDGPATHCKACKTPDMVNVNHKRCVGTECGGTKHPTFGIGDGPATHCKACKTPDMVDVVSKRCVGTECGGTKHPTFGIGDGPATHCKACKTPDMVNVVSKRCVGTECGGTKRPTFGIGDGPATHCSMCKEADMVDVQNKRCIHHTDCSKRAHQGYNDLCYHHFCIDHPSDPRVKHLKKEMLVAEILQGLGYEFDNNITYACASGNRRLDFILDLGTHYLHVECDERAHRDRNYADERLREREVHDVLGKPGWLIRINPDRDEVGNYPPMLSAKGFVRNEPEITRRTGIIQDTLARCAQGPPQGGHGVLCLFMDDPAL